MDSSLQNLAQEAKQTLTEGAVALFDSAYSSARWQVHSLVQEAKLHPYRTIGLTLAAGAALAITKGRCTGEMAEEGSVVTAGRALESVSSSVLRTGESDALSFVRTAGAGATRATSATESVTVPILKGNWSEATVGQVTLPSDHWVAKAYMNSRDGVVEVLCNGERQGTGFFVDKSGYAVTNHHVVGSPKLAYQVVLTDGSKFDARVVGVDPDSDLAIMKILNGGGREFKALKIGSSTSSSVDQAMAMGYPGQEPVVTVSPGSYVQHQKLVGRYGLHSNMEFDMVTKAGNSGSPLLDREGNVAGVINKYSFDDRSYAPTAEHLKALLDAAKSTEVGSKYLVVNTKAGQVAPTLMERILSRIGAGNQKSMFSESLSEAFQVTATKARLTATPPLVA